ncbi:MAG TPA: glycoside hydrolase family 15 protein [Bdellovibrionota bacterium]|nr:glycoside hydrolase family 15 protein [Bdellovibrionota bacterium]
MNYGVGITILLVAASQTASAKTNESLATWIAAQTLASQQLLARNISPEGAKPGTVVASPSRQAPDYYYHWVRDAGLVMSTWLDERQAPTIKARVENDLKDFWQITLHHQARATIADLGEVKFYDNGEPYLGRWGRPQNDGPAIRALSLMKWRTHLAAMGSPLAADASLYSPDLRVHSAIKRDLEYVSHHWVGTDYDVWEEVRGHHFFTRLFQRYALREGARLADAAFDPLAARWYRQNSDELALELERHWIPELGYITATLDRDEGLDYKSGLDSAVVIAVLETDGYANLDSDPWTVLDSRVQATVQRLEATFIRIYEINARVSDVKGAMIGRYPEDTYNGLETGKRGNPWFLNTFYMAEFYYKLAAALDARGELRVDNTSRTFWKLFVGNETLLTKERQPQWNELMLKLVKHGDAILAHARTYVGEAGNLAEQIHRDEGRQVGARDLSWSYSSFLRAATARERVATYLD